MDIIFEGYTTIDGVGKTRMPLGIYGPDRFRFGHVKLPFALSGAGTSNNDGTGAVHLPPLTPRGFDVAGGFAGIVLPLALSAATDALLPEIAVCQINAQSVGIRAAGAQINDGTGDPPFPLSLYATEAKAFGHVRMQVAMFGGDFVAGTDRVGLLIQQPMLFSSMSPGITVSLSDTYAGTDAHAADFIHALMDLIRYSDTYGAMAEVQRALHDGMRMADVAAFIWEAGLIDSFIAGAVQTGTAQLTVMLADTFQVSDAAHALSTILQSIQDGFYVTLTINTGEDQYTAWVMTPETKAMRSYSNFPFNSYAQLGEHFLGASATGIYRMGGPTDNGAAIRSSIRTGLLNFGSQSMKSIDLAYIGATTTGALLLRVQATTHRGESVEQTYRAVPTVTDEGRNLRVNIGKGFRSVYWTFELANDEDGADFEVHNWHVLPVTLTGKLI